MDNRTFLTTFLTETVVAILFLLGIDRLMIYLGDDPMKKNRRWYLIHAVANAVITYCSFPDLIFLMANPLEALGDFDPMAMATMIGLHLYHILISYDQMDMIDWMHHMISCIVVGGVCTLLFRGPLINFMLFFMCGLPGGIDYFLLAMRKYGYIEPITEKGINVYLNMWIRLPGILCNCYISYINAILGIHDNQHYYLAMLMIFLNAFNGIYFATRVVQNYGESLVKQELVKQRQQEKNSLRRIPSVGKLSDLEKTAPKALNQLMDEIGVSQSLSKSALKHGHKAKTKGIEEEETVNDGSDNQREESSPFLTEVKGTMTGLRRRVVSEPSLSSLVK